MFYVEVVHQNGKRYQMPVSQVVVFADSGDPIALTYDHAGLLIHSNVEQKDFASTCDQLKIKRLTLESEVRGG